MRFGLLGPLEVTDGDGSVRLGEGRQRSVLVLLLLHRNEAVSSERLIDALWGETPPPTAPKVLQNHVGHLRRALGDRHGTRLQTRGRAYLLRVEPGELDLERFEQLALGGADALSRDDAAGAAAQLRAALALWRGPALEDVAYESFAQPAIAALEERRLAALEQRIEADLALGRHAEAIPELEALAAEQPLRERPREHLMLALYRSGRQSEALEVYADARRRLVNELGVEPGPGLRELQAAILRQDPDLGPVARPRPLAASRRPLALLLAGAALIVAAVVAAIVELSGGSAGLETLAPGSVGIVDPGSGRILGHISLSGRPTRLASDGRTVWVAGDASRTIVSLDPRGRRETGLSETRGFPSDIAVGTDAAWVMDGRSGRLAKIDAHYGVIARPLITRPNPAYDLSRDGIDPISVAAGFGSVWVTDGSRTLIRIDQATAKVIGRKNLHARLNGVAVGAGAVWAISGPSATVFRVDRARKRTIPIHIVPRPGFSMPYPLAVEAGAGFVWVLNGNSADVTQIDPASSRVLGTVPIGIEHRPLRLAVGAGAAWVADADGSLARIDPGATTPKFIPVAHGLKDVAVAGRAVWVTAGSGLSPNLASSSPGSTGVVKAVPRPSCTPIYYQGREPPRYLIASDLALSAGVQIDQAIRYVLRQHRFRAGPYAVAYQSCDDWTPGGFSGRKPASNARAYAADRSVIAVIGPVGSPQTQIELPILNRAPGGALAMVNGWNTVVGLTHSGPGTAHDEPARYYPTGTRNYVRVVPADDVQGVADALAARKLGAKRVYLVILAFPGFTYGSGVAAGFRSAAAKLGIAIAGSYTEAGWSRRYKRLAARIKRTRADAVFLATTPGPGTNAATLIEDLRAVLGRRVALLAPDSFADFTGAGAAGEGLTYSIPGLPEQRLPAPGRKFVAGFSATIGTRPDLESVHAAGATEVLLSAIARSNGTRGSVARGLFSTRVRDGILGSFSIDRNGDTTASDVTIYRIARGAPRFFTVIRPPRRLIE